MPNPTARIDFFGTRLATGVAVAEPQVDGTIVVRNVPLFSEVRETDAAAQDGARQVRDRAWLETALRKHRERVAMGHKPLMTLRHQHEDPRAVGWYLLERVEDADVNPDEPARATLFGTKVYRDRAAFEEARDYTARSVEISPDWPDEVGALALLRDKEAFWKFPGLVEKLPEDARGPLVAEAFRSRLGGTPQLWRGRAETYSATNPYAVAQSMLDKGQITKAKFDEVVSAIKSEEHSASTTKEGSMPADTKDEKAPSIEEKMEAMVARCFESFMKKFEERVGGIAGGEKKDADKPEKAEGDKPKDEPKKPETAQASVGPNAFLPPAVSQARAGEAFSAAANGAAHQPQGETLTREEKQELFGLRAWAKRKEHEEKVESFAAQGEKDLLAAGVAVDDSIKAELRDSAKELGEAGVKRAVATIARFAKAPRGPEPYGAAAQFGGTSAPGVPEDLKRAVDSFGQRPETKTRIHELYSAWREYPEHFRRSVPFYDACAGNPEINPACMDPRGGVQRKA